MNMGLFIDGVGVGVVGFGRAGGGFIGWCRDIFYFFTRNTKEAICLNHGIS